MPVMGVDLGTGGVRAVVLDPDSGELIASATASIESHHPHPGWSQQAPQDWWRAACEAISKVITDGPMDGRDIQAVGLSGQMHGCTLIDAADQPLRPAILWNDQRT